MYAGREFTIVIIKPKDNQKCGFKDFVIFCIRCEYGPKYDPVVHLYSYLKQRQNLYILKFKFKSIKRYHIFTQYVNST